jgi:hypothetical protein
VIVAASGYYSLVEACRMETAMTSPAFSPDPLAKTLAVCCTWVERGLMAYTSIDYAGETAVTIGEQLAFFGEKGVGFHRLEARVQVTEHVRPGQQQQIELLSAEAEMKAADGALVGRFRSLGALDFATRSQALGNPSRDLRLFIDVDSRRLASIVELLRGDRSIPLRLEWMVAMVGPKGLQNRWVPGENSCARDSWLLALRSAGFARTAQVEVVLEDTGTSRLGASLQAFDAALTAYRRGEPASHVLTHCRKIADEASLSRAGLQIQSTPPKKMEEWTVEERLRVLHSALFTFTSPGAHEVAPEGYGPDEAALAVGLAGLLLQYHSRKKPA